MLSNGVYWRIFVADNPGDRLRIFRSRELDVADDSGLIVELLKDAVSVGFIMHTLTVTVSQILYSNSPVIEPLV